MKLSVVVTTADRPECMSIWRALMAKQTRVADELVVVDGPGTPQEKIREGIRRATGDVIVLTDDDDYYPAWWLERCAEAAEIMPLFGATVSRMYHLPTGGVNRRSRGPLIPSMGFRDEVKKDVLGFAGAVKDVWRQTHIPKAFVHAHIVAMKGMPGTERNGVSVKHRYTPERYPERDRPGRPLLRYWVGDLDYERFYRPLIER